MFITISLPFVAKVKILLFILYVFTTMEQNRGKNTFQFFPVKFGESRGHTCQMINVLFRVSVNVCDFFSLALFSWIGIPTNCDLRTYSLRKIGNGKAVHAKRNIAILIHYTVGSSREKNYQSKWSSVYAFRLCSDMYHSAAS